MKKRDRGEGEWEGERGRRRAAIAEAIMLICSCKEGAFLFYYYDFLLLLIVGSHGAGGDEAPINLAAGGAYNEERRVRRERERGGRGVRQMVSGAWKLRAPHSIAHIYL